MKIEIKIGSKFKVSIDIKQAVILAILTLIC